MYLVYASLPLSENPYSSTACTDSNLTDLEVQQCRGEIKIGRITTGVVKKREDVDVCQNQFKYELLGQQEMLNL